MKAIVGGVLLLLLVGIVNAERFSVGGKYLEIPSPKGFSLVTTKMDAVYRLTLKMADPLNDQLACYIAESDVPEAMAGKIPLLERYYIIAVNKNIKNMVVTSGKFAEFKSVSKRNNKEIIESVEAQMPGFMDKESKEADKVFDLDVALKLSRMIPLNMHYETDNIFAYSMYINYGLEADESKDDYIIPATVTAVNIEGKVIFLYCYGRENELEWTRSASKEWAEMVVSSNAHLPSGSSGGSENTQSKSSSSGSRGHDWSRMLNKGITGAITGGLIMLVYSVFSRSKKKS